MGLTLITGRAVTGKTGVLHDAVVAAAKRGQRAVLLVPSFVDVRRSRAEIVSRAPIGIEVDTLDRWAERLWGLHGDGRRFVTDPVRRLLVQEVLRNNEDNPLASTRGYRDLVATLAARTASLTLPSTRKQSQKRLMSDLLAYRQACADRGLVERGEALELLAVAPALADAVIAVNRFTDLSHTQISLITGLADRNEVLLTLNWEAGAAATEASTAAVRMFEEAGAAHQHLRADDPSTELSRVERDLFAPTAPIPRTGAVEFMTAAGEEAEAALIAATVAKLVSGGVPPHEIAVAFRDVARRELLIRAGLAAEGLSAELDMTVAFEQSPLGRSLSALMSLQQKQGGREALLSFLHSPYSVAPQEAVEDFDARARKYREEDPGALLREAARLGSGTAALLKAADSVRRAWLDSAGATAWKHLADLAVENGLERTDRSDFEIRLDGSAHRLLVEAAGELALSSGAGVPAPALLEYLAGTPTHSGGEEREGAVYVTEAHRLRSRRFRVVVIGGLTAEEFSSERREPLAAQILDELRLPAGTDERLSERLLFYSVATRARERLVLVRQSSTSTGASLRGSVFWEEMTDLYRSTEDARAGIEAVAPSETLPLSRLEQAAPALTTGRRALRRQLVQQQSVPAEAPRGVIDGTPWSDCDCDYSVTELETYVSCPYRWFYDRVIRPRELDGAFDARERGALVHSVLADFYKRFTTDVGSRVTPAVLPQAHALLDAVWNDAADQCETKTRGLAEQLAFMRALEWARDAVTQDALLFPGFVPVGQEWRFGEDAERPFVVGDARIKGSIDRLDSNGSLLIVTDYKSSTSVSGRKSWQGEGLLQVVAYGDVAATLTGIPVVGGFYRSLVSGELRGFWNTDRAQPEDWVARNDLLTEEQYGELVESTWATIRSAVEGIKRASITQLPHNNKACVWCGAASVCEARLS